MCAEGGPLPVSSVQLLETLPLWAIFLGSVAIVLVCIQVGLRLARLQKQHGDKEQGATGSVVGATLGLLAFMLAFTFGMAANRREMRRDLLLEEVNSIGTTFLRADLIPEPHRSEVRGLLRRYVDLRLEVYDRPARLPAVLKESEKLQGQLWQQATALRDAELRNPQIASLFVDSLNQTIDLQTKRVTVGRYRIPPVIWAVFCVLTILSTTAVGYHFGQSGQGNLPVHLLLALSFSIVVFLIADLDRAAEGWLKVSNQPMVELRRQMNR